MQRRRELEGGYYELVTVQKIIQAAGRGVRSLEDFAHTHILDAAFRRLFAQCHRLFPAYIKAALFHPPKPQTAAAAAVAAKA